MAPATGKTIRKTAKSAPDAEELVRQEIERQAKIAELEQEIERLEYSRSEAESISLLDIQVSSASYGIGTVIEQNINTVRVRFDNLEKSFILDAKFSARPRFENDEEIVGVFTEYARAQERIKRLRNLLLSLK